MSVKVVGVHGVGNHKPALSAEQAAARLSRAWTERLADGLGLSAPPAEVAIAYYAPHLNAALAQTSAAGLDALPPEAHQMLAAWAGHLQAAPADIPQAAWSVPARVIIDRMAARRGVNAAMLRRFAAVFLREVHTYLRAGSPARAAARDEVAQAIRRHRPRVVIAHSLGSVVAYEALWAHA